MVIHAGNPAPSGLIAALNGRLVPWEECLVHARSRGALFGANVFEGIRAYWSSDTGRLNVFRLSDHLKRLGHSARAARIPLPCPPQAIHSDLMRMLLANAFTEDVHIAVVVHSSGLVLGDPFGSPTETLVHISALPAGSTRTTHPTSLSVCVSSWRRLTLDSQPPGVKVGANYQNSWLAHDEARRHGYDAPLLLNSDGKVVEGSGFSLLVALDGRISAPPPSSGALDGLTARTLATLASGESALQIASRDVGRSELYAATEVIACGTMLEVQPIVAIDGLPVGTGQPGPVSATLRDLYFTAVLGGPGAPRSWLTEVS